MFNDLIVIFYIIAMSLMIYMERLIEINTFRTGIMAPRVGLGMMGPIPLYTYYGASLYLSITAWCLGLVVIVLMFLSGSSKRKADEDEPKITYKDLPEVKE